jgi:hypothetical protein
MAFFAYDFVGRAALVRGDDFQRTVVWQSGDPPAPVDLTGYTGEFRLYRPGEDASFLTTAVVPGAGGAVTLAVAHGVSLTVPRGQYLYVVVLTSPLGSVRTLMRGRLEAV